MFPGPGRAAVCAIALASWFGPAGVARAQGELSPPVSPAPEPELEALQPPPPSGRPRLSLAVGMGATLDSAGFASGTHVIPAFFGVGGFGDGLIGVDLGAFSS